MPDIQAGRLLDFIGKLPLDKAAMAFFSRVPHAKAYLDNTATLQVVPFYSRFPKRDDSDAFFSQVVNTPDTIPHTLLLLRRDIANLTYRFSSSSSSNNNNNNNDNKTNDEKARAQPETVALFHTAAKLNSYRGTIHGGLLATLIDEVIGFNVDALNSCAEAQEKTAGGHRFYTGYLNTSYRRPVAPGVYAVESRLLGREGRKWFFEGKVLGADGALYAEGEALFIKSRDSGI